MSRCTVTPLNAGKACTGKCSSSTCADPKAVWVLAACEGAGMLFEKGADKTFSTPLDADGAEHSLSVQDLRDKLSEGHKHHRFNQLVVVGSPVDIAWVHALIPSDVARMVVAEVRYPLLASWFANTKGIQQLQHALVNVAGI